MAWPSFTNLVILALEMPDSLAALISASVMRSTSSVAVTLTDLVAPCLAAWEDSFEVPGLSACGISLEVPCFQLWLLFGLLLYFLTFEIYYPYWSHEKLGKGSPPPQSPACGGKV